MKIKNLLGKRIRVTYLEGGVCVEGYVGEIIDKSVFVWQNNQSGAIGEISPKTKGYRYSWMVHIDDFSRYKIEIFPNNVWKGGKRIKHINRLKQKGGENK